MKKKRERDLTVWAVFMLKIRQSALLILGKERCIERITYKLWFVGSCNVLCCGEEEMLVLCCGEEKRERYLTMWGVFVLTICIINIEEGAMN